MDPRHAGSPALAVVVPVHNESDNVVHLIEEIHAALDGVIDFEAVYVDDCSSDDTPQRLADLARRFPRLRVLRHRINAGQSTAMSTGIRAARAPLIATLDGDGQNDPADIPMTLTLGDGRPQRASAAGRLARRAQ